MVLSAMVVSLCELTHRDLSALVFRSSCSWIYAGQSLQLRKDQQECRSSEKSRHPYLQITPRHPSQRVQLITSSSHQSLEEER